MNVHAVADETSSFDRHASRMKGWLEILISSRPGAFFWNLDGKATIFVLCRRRGQAVEEC